MGGIQGAWASTSGGSITKSHESMKTGVLTSNTGCQCFRLEWCFRRTYEGGYLDQGRAMSMRRGSKSDPWDLAFKSQVDPSVPNELTSLDQSRPRILVVAHVRVPAPVALCWGVLLALGLGDWGLGTRGLGLERLRTPKFGKAPIGIHQHKLFDKYVDSKSL